MRTSEYIANAIWRMKSDRADTPNFGTLMAWMKDFRELEKQVSRLQKERDELHDALCDERMKNIDRP